MTATYQPLVSVVTPMHNEAEYISECIESVIAQTYQHWEYTIVDNCSSDESSDIALRYAAKDPRIRVLRTSQLLLALPNHNGALRHISGDSKYCKVVFADDWIFPECLERMVEVAEAGPRVGVVGAYGLEGHEVVWSGLPYPSRAVAGREVCRRLFLDGLYVFGTPTSVLYRADLVRSREPFYDESNVHADMEVCIALLREWDFGFVHQVLTWTRVRPQSRIVASRDLNTLAASKLRDLVKYGREFLSEDEFRNCVRRSIAEYYKYLAGSAVRGRDKKFWEFHRKALADVGEGFSSLRLARGLVSRMLEGARNPADSIKRLLRDRADRCLALDGEVEVGEGH